MILNWFFSKQRNSNFFAIQFFLSQQHLFTFRSRILFGCIDLFHLDFIKGFRRFEFGFKFYSDLLKLFTVYFRG